MRRIALFAPLALLLACDADKDGISNSVEEDIGTNPDSPDTDGDGLTDLEEYETYLTNPNALDTDEDGYSDPDEIAEGSDPISAESRIYSGGWPYNADKDGLNGPALGDSGLQVGDKFPRFTLSDQFGETVDIYDFFGQGRPAIVDISAMWCGPCNALADMVAEGEDEYGMSDEWSHIHPAIETQDLTWITILGENRMSNAMALSNAEAWDDTHHHPLVPILWENSKDTALALLADAWPTVYFVDADGTILARPGASDDAFYDALYAADDGTQAR